VKWRLMLVGPRSGAENMARDEALMDRARETGETVFSVYSWEAPTLSLGRNQTARDKYDLARIKSRGMQVVRRPTGGRALLHHREVTYSVTAPVRADEPLSKSYERINALLLAGLAAVGVNATEAGSDTRSLTPGDIPCFAEPAKGELSWNGKKLVGSAQVRENGALLQHGSILIEDDQPLISAVSLSPPSVDAAPAATLTRALGRAPSVDEVAAALFDAVREREDHTATTLDESDLRAATDGRLEKYTSEWWTWRR
jgi:lipoate-protein ligase A